MTGAERPGALARLGIFVGERLVRDAPDFSPLDFCQRFTGTFSDDQAG